MPPKPRIPHFSLNSLGSVRVPLSSTVPHPYIPYGHLPLLPPSSLTHLEWLLQKHTLAQDTLLLSPPSTLPYLLATSYAEAVNLKFYHTQVTSTTLPR